MATDITLRSVKGSALTHSNVDQNFESLSLTIDGKTSNYSVLYTDQNKIIEMNGSSLTVTLPAIAAASGTDTDSFCITIKNIHSSNLTVDGDGSETIEGTGTITLTQWGGVMLSLNSAGTEWITITTLIPQLEAGLLPGLTATSAELNVLDGITSSTTELNVLNGVPAGLTATEIGYSDGVTSSIQAQLNTKISSVSESDLAWSSLAGVSQSTTEYSTPYSTTSSTYATMVIHKIYIPANVNSMEYYVYMKASSSTSNFRLTATSLGTAVATSSASYLWSGSGSLDVSSESGWTDISLQLNNGGGATATIAIHSYFFK